MRSRRREIEKLNGVQTLHADLGLKLFDWSQNVAELVLGSNNRQKREILDFLRLHRAMSGVRLLLAKGKPFDLLSERLKCQSRPSDWTTTSDLRVQSKRSTRPDQG